MTRADVGSEPYPIKTAMFWPWFTPLYDVGCRALGFGRAFRQWSIEPLPTAPTSRILDLGCATGAALAAASARNGRAHYFGVDPDPGALKIARRNASGAFLVGRGEALPFRDRSFDAIFSSLALHHIPDAWKLEVLVEVARVLRDGATFVFVDFENHARWWVPPRFRSRWPLRRWLEAAGFDCLDHERRWGAHRFVARQAAFTNADDRHGP